MHFLVISGYSTGFVTGLSRVWLSLGLVVSLTAGLLVGLPSPAGAVAGYGDVGEGTWYTDAVQWSVDNGIADIAGFCFAPDTPVSRGETAVWIYNMENQPAAGDSHSFTDVTEASQNDAISWMANNEITTGKSPTTFAPAETLTRAEAATFLHRLAGKPSAPPHNFVDVVAGWQQRGVPWMAHTGITTGTSATTFAPEDTLTRAHLVTFLYRYQNEPDVTINTTTPTCDPTAAAEPQELSAVEVYSRVAPSVPLIETDSGATGSGILIEGGYVVTNYHVVWPHEEVWVVFADGTEFQDVPVVGWDPFADLAVLGPLDVSAPPLRLGDGEALAPGSELFLVGYPAETDLFPEPTITRGILSRTRQWDLYDLTLFQTDAAIAGGQSGGALVDARGEVIGISTWSFSDAGFAVATSAADDAEIVDSLIEDFEADQWTERRVASGSGEFEHNIELPPYYTQTYVFTGSADALFVVEVEGPGDALLRVSNEYGVIAEVDDTYDGQESLQVELDLGTYFLDIELLSNETSSFSISSTTRLTPFHDSDDGRFLAEEEDVDVVAGVFDHYSDFDFYVIELDEGETVLLYTDSIIADPTLTIVDPFFVTVAFDDDSGNSVFGISTNAEIVYTAETSGEHIVLVDNPSRLESGDAYLLVVERLQ